MTEPQPSRIAFLRERVDAADRAINRTTFDVPFRQRQISLVKIDVPINFPLYNIRSGRTHRAQTQWIERNGKPGEFFDDAEDDEVQNAQHSLLLDMIQQEGLDADLTRRNQRNPIVLTLDGFIVDGNRRVAALRAAGEAENATAVVLPQDATMSEVFETELEFQMARETRADYNWIDQGLHVRYGIAQLGEQVSSVALRMNFQEREVNDILQRMMLVDLYLAWAGAPDAYHKVRPDSEQSFIELAEREGNQQFRNLPATHREAIRLACFSVIQSGGGYMDVRNVFNTMRGQPATVADRLRERLPEELAAQLDAPVTSTVFEPAEDDLLSLLEDAAIEGMVTPGAEILNVVRDPADGTRSAPHLIDVARDLVEENRENLNQLEPLRKLARALRILRGIQITPDTQQLNAVAERLDEVIEEADRIATAVSDRRTVDGT